MGFREDFFSALESCLKKYTQAELASMTGVAQSQVSKVFGKNRKTQNPGLKFVAAILDDLDMAIYPRGSVGEETAREISQLRDDLKKKDNEFQQLTIERHRLEGQVDLLREMLDKAKETEEDTRAPFLKKSS